MFTIPALVVLISVWIVMNKLFKNEEEKRLWELKLASQKEISPTRLRAYERLALVLERTQPEALVMGLSERMGTERAYGVRRREHGESAGDEDAARVTADSAIRVRPQLESADLRERRDVVKDYRCARRDGCIH